MKKPTKRPKEFYIKAGKKGGERTKELYGTKHFSLAGKIGWANRRKQKETISYAPTAYGLDSTTL